MTQSNLDLEALNMQLGGVSSSTYCIWGDLKIVYLNGDVDGNADLLSAADAMGDCENKSISYTDISKIRGEFVYQLVRKENQMDEIGIRKMATNRRVKDFLGLWTQQSNSADSVGDPELGVFGKYTFPYLNGDYEGNKDLLLSADDLDGLEEKGLSYTKIASIRGEFVYQLLKIENTIDEKTARVFATIDNTSELLKRWSQDKWIHDTGL